MRWSLFYIGVENKVLLEPHWEAFALTSEKKKSQQQKKTDARLFRLVRIEWRRLSIVFKGNSLLILRRSASAFPHKSKAPKGREAGRGEEGGGCLITSDLL